MPQSYTYIMTNKKDGTLYIGVTSDIIRRVYEHKSGFVDGFTKKYNLKMLVYYEIFDDISEAILREKYLKGKKRSYKLELINNFNQKWDDLYERLI
ncbi:MAG: GIY-YIG nuclease family protein [Campylobacterota bacterium]|nr:GIY-YIG nuclease family protein [Campylobacterota bacterium]